MNKINALGLLLIYVIMNLLFFIYDCETLVEREYYAILNILFIILNIFYLYQLRQSSKYISISKTFGVLFLVNIFMNLFSKILEYVTVFWYKPELVDKLTEKEIQAIEAEVASMGATNNMSYEDVERFVINSYDWNGIFKSFLISIPFLAFFTIILILLFSTHISAKKKNNI